MTSFETLLKTKPFFFPPFCESGKKIHWIECGSVAVLVGFCVLKDTNTKVHKRREKKKTVKAENYMSVFLVLNGTCNLPATDLQSHTCSSPC